MPSLFIDTNVIVASVTPQRTKYPYALAILLQNKCPLVVNVYVIKELRRVLPAYIDDRLVSRMVEFVETKARVVDTPRKEEFRKIVCRDRSDAPIICSALKEGCALITEDRITREDASIYVPSMGMGTAVRVLGFRLPVEKQDIGRRTRHLRH